MRVLVVNDSDGHCHVYDASTEKKAYKLIADLYSEYPKGYYNNTAAGKLAERELKFDIEEAKTLDELLDVGFKHGLPTTDRSGGGIMYFEKISNEYSPSRRMFE